jgi:stage II sporulation protein AA (anti-sigma F factor antagonist)
MDIMTVEDIGDEITNVTFSGRLDSIGAASVGQRFNAQVSTKRAVIVDLSDVDYVASLAIRFLLAGAKAVKGNSGKFIILSPDEYVYSVLKTAGIDLMIPILFDRSEAIAAVRP